MKGSVAHMVRENVRALKPYKSARGTFTGDNYILLDANENPVDNAVNRYPDPYQTALKAKMATVKGVQPSQIFVGNGSDEIIDLLIRCFCEPSEHSVYAFSPSFGMYKVAAGLNAVDIHFFSLNKDFSLDAEGMLNEVKESDRIIFLCTPNNPTANVIPSADLKKICEQFEGIVMVDEAYIDFTDEPSMILSLDEYSNLVVLQTMSKSWGAAGLRVGFAYASQEIVSFLNKIKAPYNVNSLSQAKALELLDDHQTYLDNVAFMNAQRKWLSEELVDCPEVIKVHPSDTNFILVQFKNPLKTYEKLKAAGIVVRDRSSTHLCEGCLRISVGLEDENKKTITVLKSMAE